MTAQDSCSSQPADRHRARQPQPGTVRDPQVGIKAVFFDAAGTLLRVARPVGHAYAAKAARYGVDTDPDALDGAFVRIWKARCSPNGTTSSFPTSEDAEHDWWCSIVREVFEAVGALKRFGGQFEPYFDDVYEHFAQPAAWHVFEDVRPTLDALAGRGVRSAVVSNWDSRLPRLLKALGLGARFEFVLTSAEAGYRKPDAAIFRCALAQMGLSPREAIHVGDSVAEDVAGARNAGITPILLRRSGDAVEGVITIGQLTEVTRHLGH